MAIYQYIRTSTKKQVTEGGRQEFTLKDKYKIDKIFSEKISGKSKDNRPQLKKLIDTVQAGDIVVASELSRLGRNLKDCIEIFEELIGKGVQVICDKEGIDSNSSTYKLLLGIFGAVAEMEREQITERIQQSADQWKETGVTPKGKTQWGKKALGIEDLPKNFTKYYNQMKNNEINKAEMSRLLNTSRQTVYSWIKVYEAHYDLDSTINKEAPAGECVPVLTEEVGMLSDGKDMVEVVQGRIDVPVKPSKPSKKANSDKKKASKKSSKVQI